MPIIYILFRLYASDQKAENGGFDLKMFLSAQGTKYSECSFFLQKVLGSISSCRVDIEVEYPALLANYFLLPTNDVLKSKQPFFLFSCPVDVKVGTPTNYITSVYEQCRILYCEMRHRKIEPPPKKEVRRTPTITLLSTVRTS